MDQVSAVETGSAAPTQDTETELTDEAILATFQRRLKESQSHRAEWRDEAKNLYDVVAGRQWGADDVAKLDDEGRPHVTFNVAGKFMDAMTGLQINNRQEIKFAAREPGDLRVNELLTGAVSWGRDLSSMADDETDAFFDCILTGEGWMEGYIDKDLDEAGCPAGARVDPMEVFPDPHSRQRNYQDARYLTRIKWVDSIEYRELVGDKEGEATLPDFASLEAEDEDGLMVIEQIQDYQHDRGATAASRKRRPIADYQWWQREDAYLVSSQRFGSQTFSAEEWAGVEPMLSQVQDQYKVEKIRRRTFYRAIIAGATVVQKGRSPYQQGFTLHAVTGKRDRNKRCWYGIGRTILEPQMWVNKFFSTLLYALMTNSKGGLMAEEGAFQDQRKAESEWADPSAITWMKAGALQAGMVQPKPASPYPQGLDRLMEFSLNALPQTSGLNVELLGLADRVQAGVVEAQRKQSAMAIVAWAFDGMRRYYRAMGRMLAIYVHDYVPDGTLIKVTGEQGKQYVPLVKSQLSLKFDTIVDEAPTSVNMQERIWLVLQQIIPQLLQAGMAIPKEVLDYSPLPADLVEKWKQALTPDPKKQSINERSVEETLKKLIADVQKTSADAQLSEAKAAQIQQELQNPKGDPQAEMRFEVWKAQMEATVERSIAQLKINRDAETKLLMKEMDVHSKERIAALEAAIDARLQTQAMHAGTHPDVKAQEDAKAEKRHKELIDTHSQSQAVIAKAVEQMGGAMKEVSAAVKESKRPRKIKIKRDAAGDAQEITQE